MALMETINGMKILCRQCLQLNHLFVHPFNSFAYRGLHKAKFYKSFFSQASRTASFKTNSTLQKTSTDPGSKTTASQDKKSSSLGLPSDVKEEDVFGLLADADGKQFVPKKHKPKNTTSSNLQAQRNTNSWTSAFGTLCDEDDILTEESKKKRFENDEQEIDESEQPYVRLDKYNRKHPPDWYGRQIAKFGREGKVYEAIQVLENDMLKEDRVLPNQYVFTVLIGVLGRNGYTKKAFQIFNKMKKFGLAPQAPTYTALFNACSNSPWIKDGLERANGLRQLMLENEYEPNLMTYNAMIKTYAKCGDLRTAFAIVDEAVAAGHKPDGHCYSALLMACISDKEAGLKHAIEVWRMMRKRKLTPVTYHYNLLLHAVRDCSLGNEQFAQELIHSSKHLSAVGTSKARESIFSPKAFISVNKHEENQVREACRPLVESSSEQQDAKSYENFYSVGLNSNATNKADHCIDKSTVTNEEVDILMPLDKTESDLCAGGASVLDAEVPNLLNPRWNYANLIRLMVPETPTGRLAFLGGLPGILGHMNKDHATPDIKTFALLLDTMPSSTASEIDLLSAMTLNKVTLDVDFCSMMIRRRNKRKDYEGAKDVLKLMDRFDLKPTIRTFGCLAMGCPNKKDAINLLEHMEKAQIVPTAEIFDILTYQSYLDFNYKIHILLAMKSLKIQPNPKIIEKFERHISKARNLIVRKERGEVVSDLCNNDHFTSNFHKFMKFYKPWLQSTNLEQEVHPWAKYVQPTPEMPTAAKHKKRIILRTN